MGVNSRFVTLLIVIILFTSGCGGGSSGNSSGNSILNPDSPPENQDTADTNPPDFTLSAINGIIHTLSDYKGKVVLINFFASWCPSCVDEMPDLEDNIWQRFRRENVVVIGVDMGEDIKTVTNFAFNMGLTFPIVLDPKRDVVVEITDFISVPVYVIVDQAQKIRFQDNGYRESIMISIIDNLLSKNK